MKAHTLEGERAQLGELETRLTKLDDELQTERGALAASALDDGKARAHAGNIATMEAQRGALVQSIQDTRARVDEFEAQAKSKASRDALKAISAKQAEIEKIAQELTADFRALQTKAERGLEIQREINELVSQHGAVMGERERIRTTIQYYQPARHCAYMYKLISTRLRG